MDLPWITTHVTRSISLRPLRSQKNPVRCQFRLLCQSPRCASGPHRRRGFHDLSCICFRFDVDRLQLVNQCWALAHKQEEARQNAAMCTMQAAPARDFKPFGAQNMWDSNLSLTNSLSSDRPQMCSSKATTPLQVPIERLINYYCN